MILKEFLKLTEGLSKLQQTMILEHVLQTDCSKIFLDPDFEFTDSNTRAIQAILKKLKTLQPLEYILGHAYFYNAKFQVNANVLIPRSETEVLVNKYTLIPRPETELLVYGLLKIFNNKKISVLDIGTGSGCIICTLAHELESTLLIASDISREALQVAKSNAKLLRVKNIDFHEANLLVKLSLPKQIDLLIANLPYVDPDSYVTSSTKLHEPHLALYSEEGGLNHIRRLLEQVQTSITEFTNILLEFGYGQEQEIQVICERILPQYDLTFFQDFNSVTRFCHLKLKNV